MTQKASTAKNPAPVAQKEGAPVDFSTWEEVQVGFAPYWSPDENKSFVGFVVARIGGYAVCTRAGRWRRTDSREERRVLHRQRLPLPFGTVRFHAGELHGQG